MISYLPTGPATRISVAETIAFGQQSDSSPFYGFGDSSVSRLAAFSFLCQLLSKIGRITSTLQAVLMTFPPYCRLIYPDSFRYLLYFLFLVGVTNFIAYLCSEFNCLYFINTKLIDLRENVFILPFCIDIYRCIIPDF